MFPRSSYLYAFLVLAGLFAGCTTVPIVPEQAAAPAPAATAVAPSVEPLHQEADAAPADQQAVEIEDGPDADQADESVLDAALELIDTSQEHWAVGDRDRAIESLDQAYAIILKVPADADPKEVQQKEDLRFVISKRLTEIYVSRFTSVNGSAKEIPLTINEHVEREIRLFQTIELDFFLES